MNGKRFFQSRASVAVVLVVITLLLFVSLFEIYPIPNKTISTNPLWLDTTRTIEERVEALLAVMTLEEKIGQMSLVEKNSLITPDDIATYGLGGVLSGAGSKSASNTAGGWSEMTAQFQTIAATSRLGIPLLYGADAIHGHALVPGATVFPHHIGLGATGDSDLVRRIGSATAADLRATGVNWNYAPNLDLPQDARWGRVYEAFSDDPLLVGRLGAAYVSGLQASTSEGEVLATLKHYIGLGSMQWQTSSNKSYQIDQGITSPNEEVLQNVYLPPFEAGVSAGAQSVMVGLNGWGDTKLVNQRSLIIDVLKNDMRFNGFVVSDWYGIYEGNGNRFFATVRSINAGIDMVMLPFDYKTFKRHMVIANRLGLIKTARIDDATRRILRAKFNLGLFDSVPSISAQLGNHHSLAKDAVAQSLVLLKNEEAVLPLSLDTRHIRIAGSAADNVGKQSGAWTVEWQGVDGNWLPGGVSILAGIVARAPQSTFIEFSASGTFATSVEADLGIAIVGESPYAEGWGDREYPILSNEDLDVIARLQANSKKVLVILVSGRPLLIENELPEIDALVAAWLPGTAGDGLADVLFGDKNFSGTLPLPWPKTAEQLPFSVTGESADGTPALYPRYYGLSY